MLMKVKVDHRKKKERGIDLRKNFFERAWDTHDFESQKKIIQKDE
jgi:hypothetical protein